ncbi:MAG TPA: hypothetical protein VHK90_06620 [Thermoanaerobaculia bacterium]|nr:hypothetical protein [Thermoanaerobaculia bacterium]
MTRKLLIALVLLFATLLPTVSDAGGYQRYVIYYSDSTFTTPVGKKFYPSTEGCDAPYDSFHSTGSVTSYVYTQFRDVCGTQGGSVLCNVDGTYVSCPSGMDWVSDWWSLGDEW